MTDIAIRVENLGKQYKIGRLQKRHDTLRDKISDFPEIRRRLSIFDLAKRRNGKNHQSEIINQKSQDTIWALRDVSFEVKRGEVVGIIGRNGAGKSTLLKILSRITEPTTGAVDLYGRVASLLEVGTGFHPELTGRENIFLNGAILGMHRTEIERKFDEIVAFAEVEKFIDTPVKRYSSGMYVRLAFAVAAHLEPEILLVDEVLAVGDAAFQKKCLGKMGDVAREGRTVLFVSHNMPMILRLCERSLLFDNGIVLQEGITHEVINYYMSSGVTSPAARDWQNIGVAPGDQVARLKSVRVTNEQGQIIELVDIRAPVVMQVEYWNLQSKIRPTVILHVTNEDGVTLFATNDFSNLNWKDSPRVPSLVRATCRIPGNFLAEGHFFVLVAVGSYNPNLVHALVQDAVSFRVFDPSEGDGVRGEYVGGYWPGVVRPMLIWEVVAESDPCNTRLED